MNVNDIEQVKVQGDLLKAIVSRQLELETEYRKIESANLGIEVPEQFSIDNQLHQFLIKDAMWRIVEELGEAANCLKNKPWKQTHVQTDVNHFLEELSDALHFFVRLLVMLGLSAEDICMLYFKKSEVNLFRQRSQY